jgi:hypothetical protein
MPDEIMKTNERGRDGEKRWRTEPPVAIMSQIKAPVVARNRYGSFVSGWASGRLQDIGYQDSYLITHVGGTLKRQNVQLSKGLGPAASPQSW